MADREPPHGYDDKGRPIWARGAHGRPVCGHKRKNGSLCQSEARFPNGRCKVGGGKAGRPLLANPSPETLARRGRSELYRKLNITRLVEEARADTELASNLENIRFLEALIASGMEDFSPPVEIWKQALTLYEQAVKGGNAQALIDLGKLLEQGQAMHDGLDRIVELMDEQRKHRDSELKREAYLQNNLTARQMNFVIANLLAAVEKEVKDPGTLRAIGLHFARLSGR